MKLKTRFISLVMSVAVLLSCLTIVSGEDFSDIFITYEEFIKQYDGSDISDAELAARYLNMKYFLQTYPDWHFDLTKEPNRIMTIEEYIALAYAYSYYGSGAGYVTVRDKNGNSPSAWCAKYVQAEADKKTFNPEKISWSDPVTIAFVAEFMSRSKGKYSYDSNNIYSFTGTDSLSADEKLFLSVAADCGLIQYRQNMNAMTQIPRKDMRLYEIPANAVYAKPMIKGNANSMRECNAYFIDCYWDLEAASKQARYLRYLADHITMVTFQCAYINGYNVDSGNVFLGCDIEHKEALSSNRKYKHDPQLDAIEFCKSRGISALLGVSNAGNNDFSASSVVKMLSGSANMRTAVNEIMSAVRKYDLDGVHMGFEITDTRYASLRSNYITFLTMLRSALNEDGKLLVVSVASYPTDDKEEASFYDYSAIGRVADFVHFILYDDFTDTGYATRGTDGPMSSLVRIGRCLRYAATKMPRGKVLLGLSAYATDFNLTKRTAEDISHEEAAELRKNNNADVVYMNENGEAAAYFMYSEGYYADHKVYLETPDTAKQRAQLVLNYNLGGFSVYNISDGYQELFVALTECSSYKSEIMMALDEEIIPNSLRGSYDAPIKRNEFCRMVVAVVEAYSEMSAEMFMREEGYSVNRNAFSDTSEREVLIANALGIVEGYGNRLFKPENTITRQEAAAMLMRLAKLLGMRRGNASAVSFDELPSLQNWAQTGINFVSSCVDPRTGKRVMGGTGNNKFSPYSSYTREQSAMSALRLLHAIEA